MGPDCCVFCLHRRQVLERRRADVSLLGDLLPGPGVAEKSPI